MKDQTILDDGTNITEPNDEEGDALEEEVDVIAPFAIHEIVASDQEQEYSNSQLQEVHSVKFIFQVNISSVRNFSTKFTCTCYLCVKLQMLFGIKG